MSSKRYLTKSRFKLGLECPAKLYYTDKLDYANTKQEVDFPATSYANSLFVYLKDY